jgi:hypothetical protein
VQAAPQSRFWDRCPKPVQPKQEKTWQKVLLKLTKKPYHPFVLFLLQLAKKVVNLPIKLKV